MRKIAFLSLLALACGGSNQASAPPHLDIPVQPVRTSGAQAANKNREPPPASLASKPSPFPTIARAKLDSGLRVAVVSATALPIVQVRLVTFAGMGYGAAGAAQLTAEILKEGGTRAMTSATMLSRVEA